jgi:hypothetical protein
MDEIRVLLAGDHAMEQVFFLLPATYAGLIFGIGDAVT